MSGRTADATPAVETGLKSLEKEGMPAHPLKSAKTLFLLVYHECKELGLTWKVNLPVLPDISAEDTLFAFFL